MKSVGFAGAGAMGTALLGAMIRGGGLAPASAGLFEADNSRAEAASRELGVRRFITAEEILKESDLVFLCVKPQHMPALLGEMKPHLRAGQVLVSIAAGLSMKRLREMTGPAPVALVRVMPNTPALAGAGVSGVSFGEGIDGATRQLVLDLLGHAGRTVVVDEKYMNVVTAVSGSGPAYFFVAIEALADAGVRHGLTRDVALLLATETVRGAAELVRHTGAHPAVLKDQVCSPGGTTIAALEALEDSGFRRSFYKAVAAAVGRAEELGG